MDHEDGGFSDMIQVTRNKDELIILAVENIYKGGNNFTLKVKTIKIPVKK